MSTFYLSISPNETNTPERVADLQKALKDSPIECAGKNPDQPADLMMWQGTKRIHIEVKDTNSSNDLWGSKQGHLGDQLVKLIDEQSPSFIVVLGSLEDVLGEVPVMTNTGHKTKWAGRHIQEQNKTSLRALSADCLGSGVPIFYLSKDRVLSFKWTLSYAKNLLEGGNPFQWTSRHKGKAGKIAALTKATGIGAKNAEALIEHFGSIKRISLASYDDLVGCPGIGRERAIAVMQLLN